jgi:hypothetical protein
MPGESEPRSGRAAEEARIGPLGLEGMLTLPEPGCGIVLFAHGSGSGRLSPRNVFVATELQRAGFGTLLFDLFTAPEAMDRRNVFDIGLLADRLLLATEWLTKRTATRDLPVGYFTSAAASRRVSSVCLRPLPAGGGAGLRRAVPAAVEVLPGLPRARVPDRLGRRGAGRAGAGLRRPTPAGVGVRSARPRGGEGAAQPALTSPSLSHFA